MQVSFGFTQSVCFRAVLVRPGNLGRSGLGRLGQFHGSWGQLDGSLGSVLAGTLIQGSCGVESQSSPVKVEHSEATSGQLWCAWTVAGSVSVRQCTSWQLRCGRKIGSSVFWRCGAIQGSCGEDSPSFFVRFWQCQATSGQSGSGGMVSSSELWRGDSGQLRSGRMAR